MANAGKERQFTGDESPAERTAGCAEGAPDLGEKPGERLLASGEVDAVEQHRFDGVALGQRNKPQLPRVAGDGAPVTLLHQVG